MVYEWWFDVEYKFYIIEYKQRYVIYWWMNGDWMGYITNLTWFGWLGVSEKWLYHAMPKHGNGTKGAKEHSLWNFMAPYFNPNGDMIGIEPTNMELYWDNLGYGVMTTSCFYPNGTFYGSPSWPYFPGLFLGYAKRLPMSGVSQKWHQHFGHSVDEPPVFSTWRARKSPQIRFNCFPMIETSMARHSWDFPMFESPEGILYGFSPSYPILGATIQWEIQDPKMEVR